MTDGCQIFVLCFRELKEPVLLFLEEILVYYWYKGNNSEIKISP